MPGLGVAYQTLSLLVRNQKQASPERCRMKFSTRKEVIDDDQKKKEISDHRDAMGYFMNPLHRPTKDAGFANNQSREQNESLVCLWRVSIAKREVREA